MNRSKLKVVFLHLTFWLLMCTVPLVLVPMVELNDGFDEIKLSAIVHVTLLISVFYFNYYFLYPRFFIRKKILTYVALCLFTAFSFTTVYGIVSTVSNELTASPVLFVFVKSFISLAVIAISTFYRLMVDTVKQQQVQQIQENETLKSQLSFLRSQVSPHFMFNVLNSIVALVRQKSDQLEPIVLQLSNLMRYMLYESDEDRVMISTEIEYLKSYINIQLIRFANDVSVKLDIQDELPNRSIEPMLLIPLVENAFKHGIGMIDQPQINIRVRCTGSDLVMQVENKYRDNFRIPDKKGAGIGLENLRKRLSLLYPAVHTIAVLKDDEWFRVSLLISLKNDMEKSFGNQTMVI